MSIAFKVWPRTVKLVALGMYLNGDRDIYFPKYTPLGGNKKFMFGEKMKKRKK